MASSNKLTRQAKKRRAAEGVSLSEAKRQIASGLPDDGYSWNLLGIRDFAAYKPAQRWSIPSTAGQLPITVGGDVTGDPIVVDLAEYSLGGHGPHWSITTAPGNDAAGLVQFVAADLAVRNAPTRLQMAVFGSHDALRALEGMPHIVPESVGLTAAEWREWVERTIVTREKTLAGLGVRDWFSYLQLPAEAQTLAEIVMFVVPGDENEDKLTGLALRCGRALGIHVILCAPKPPGNEGHFSVSLRMVEPQTKAQVTAHLAQLQREHPGSTIAGDPAEVPVGAGLLTVRGDSTAIYNFNAYPPPPLRELAGRLTAARQQDPGSGE